MSVLPDHIESRLREEVANRNMVLLDVKRRGERGTSVLEIVLDSEEGVKLDDLTEMSRWLSALLDEDEDAVPGRYRLEVSSAGLDRPLEYPWQYRKNIGRLLKITMDDPAGARTTDLYQLVGVNADALMLAPKRKGVRKGAGTAAEPIAVPFAQVVRAVVEPQF